MEPGDPADVDPQELLELQEKEKEHAEEIKKDEAKLRLNTTIAVTVALLATFIGICKIKDNNMVLGMEHAQASSIDDWNYYQARNIREAIYETTADAFHVQALATSDPKTKEAFTAEMGTYRALAKDQDKKKADLYAKATNDDRDIDRHKTLHDLFDLEEALLSIAVSLLAVTALTQRRWLFGAALVPAAIGIVCGILGLANDFHAKLDAVTRIFG